eukprot:g19692.t1
MNQRSGWAKYSTKLESSGILWTERNMMAFLKNPKAFAGGVINMNFRGIDSWQESRPSFPPSRKSRNTGHICTLSNCSSMSI